MGRSTLRSPNNNGNDDSNNRRSYFNFCNLHLRPAESSDLGMLAEFEIRRLWLHVRVEARRAMCCVLCAANTGSVWIVLGSPPYISSRYLCRLVTERNGTRNLARSSGRYITRFGERQKYIPVMHAYWNMAPIYTFRNMLRYSISTQELRIGRHRMRLFIIIEYVNFALGCARFAVREITRSRNELYEENEQI